jgi:hypothetical protein
MKEYSVEALSIQMGANEYERRLVWLQSPEHTGAYIRIATVEDYERGGGFTEENSRRVAGTVTPICGREEPFVSCKVRIGELSPGTEYIYRTECDSASAKAAHRFLIPADLAEKQSFFLISDLHINVYRRPLNQWDPDGTKALAAYEKTLQSAIRFGKTPPAFFLSVGDNISCCNMGASMFPEPEKFTKKLSADLAFLEHREFFSVNTAKSLPFASVLGNHDDVNISKGLDPIGDLTNAFYDLPNDDGYSGHYLDSSSGDFWFTSGEILVVGINGIVSAGGNLVQCDREIHRAFIERAVAEAPATKWRILLCHVPAYSYVEGAEYRAAGTTCGTTGERTERARMADFFSMLSDPFGFDIVFTGHQHAFSRTYPLLDGRVVGEEARTVERHEDNTVTVTLTRPRGVIHYNLSAAMNHAFFSNLPMEPEALYPAYGVTEAALAGGAEVPNADKFAGVTYKSSTYTHVTLSREGDEAVMTVSAVRSDTGEAFDTLIIKK